MNTIKQPEVVVFAGPNGSGKSTITQLLRPIGIDYINADDIKRTTGCTDLAAAQAATKLREEHVAAGKPFCFETVMSTDRNLNLHVTAPSMSAAYMAACSPAAMTFPSRKSFPAITVR